jgi:hypothetical protein
MTLHKIKEFYTEWFRVYPNMNSKFRTIGTFKTALNKTMIQTKLIGMSIISSSFVYVQRFMSCLHKTNYEF